MGNNVLKIRIQPSVNRIQNTCDYLKKTRIFNYLKIPNVSRFNNTMCQGVMKHLTLGGIFGCWIRTILRGISVLGGSLG